MEGPAALAVKAVLFDLDGTFADTAPDMARFAGLTVTQPMKGKSIGKQLQWLNKENA